MGRLLLHWLYGRVCEEKGKSSLRLFINISAPFYLVPAGLKPKFLCDLNTLGQVGYPCVDGVSLGLKLDAFVPQIDQLHMKDFDKLVLLQLGLQVLIFRQTHVDANVDHFEVGVAEAWIW